MADFHSYWKNRVFSAEFRSRIEELRKRAWQEFLDTPMVEILQVIAWQIEKLPVDTSWHKALEQIGRDVHDMVSQRIKEANLSPQEVLEATTIALWRKFVARPVELDEKTVSTLVDAPAVRELFVTIIHDSIIEFNKKFNPFFGGLAALGIDKQIREFIIPFMGHISELAKNFILNPANRTKMAEFHEIAFDLIIRQKPDFFYNLSTQEANEVFIEALHNTFQDHELKKFVLDIFYKYKADVEAKHGQKSLGQYLSEYNIHPTVPELKEEELNFYLQKLATSQTVIWFLEEEFTNYRK